MTIFRSEIAKDSTLLKGKYCLTFHCLIKIPDIVIKILSSSFMEFAIYDVKYNHPTLQVYIHVLANPIPVAVIVGGVVGVLVLGLAVLSLTKVEKIVDAPGGIILVGAIGVIAMTGLLKEAKAG
jgi:hypothetical protein